MNARRSSDLERTLSVVLEDLAPHPRPSLLARTLAAVNETPQRSTAARRVSGLEPGTLWPYAGSTALIAVAVALAVVVGTTGTLLLTARPSPSLPIAIESPTATPSASEMPIGEPTDGPAPFATWERIELPDAAPDMLGGGVPLDVVAFGDGYVAVGSFRASCVSDITQAPPTCAEALAALPAPEAAMVWLSPDGRQWEQLPYQAAFGSGSMGRAATDGTSIVVTGTRDGRPVVWTSEDGRAWELIDSGILVPDQLVATTNGFVGARATAQGPQFLASDDGSVWRALTAGGELGPGDVFGMALGVDGATVVAVGAIFEYDGQELASITAASWHTSDGLSWTQAPPEEPRLDGAWMSAAAETPSGWAAVGLDQAPGRSTLTAAWTSPDGMNWTRVPESSSPVSQYGHADQLAWAEDRLVATGTIAGESGSVAAAWVSDDGSSWSGVPRQPALTDGHPVRVIAVEGGVLAVGGLQFATDRTVGVVWLASR